MKFAETNRLCRKKFKRLTGMSRRTFYLIVNIIKEYEKKKNKLGRPCRLIPEAQVLIAIQYWREYRTYFHIGCEWGGEQVKAEEQINYLTKASIGYGIEKRVGKRQK